MKTKVLLAVLLGAASFSYAQQGSVGIGTTKPDNSAILDLSASNKGILIPRMSLAQRDLIHNPAIGLKVYQIDSTPGEYSFTGTKWVKVLTTADANSVAAAGLDWATDGNTGITASDFIGTIGGGGNTVNFKVDGTPSGSIDKGGRTFLGYQAGSNGALAHYGSTAIGYRALINSTGSNNTALGFQALLNTGTGYNNVGIGYNALGLNTGGFNNLAIGGSALETNQGGNENVALGASSLNLNSSGSFNVALGASALRKTTTSNNIAIGAEALKENTIGANNFGLGFRAGLVNTTGSNNLFIGYQAGPASAIYSGESGKLYISNSQTDMPLVYGDFSAKYVTIGDVSPALRNQGTATGGYNLLVKGGILTEKVKVALASAGTDWADYVFASDYKLMPLEEVEKFSKENKHLPNVPSAEEMVKNGLDISASSKMFMEKIEELTLYIIELNKEVKALKVEKASLQNNK